MTRQFTITAVVIKEPQMVGDTILINVPVKEGDVLKINGQEVFLPSATPDAEWESELDGIEESFPMATYNWSPEDWKSYIRKLLSSRDTYWKKEIRGERQRIWGALCNIAEPDERQFGAGDLNTHLDDVHKIIFTNEAKLK